MARGRSPVWQHRYSSAMPQASSVFGEIPGYPEGSTFGNRDEVRQAGLHRHGRAGISGHYEAGADAIIISGGYADDVDEGDRIIYTGQGGQAKAGGDQSDHQELIMGNLALARAEERGVPVRVIRGSGGDAEHSPKSGYRYDGLYTVVQHWQEPSITTGKLVWRYVLEKADGGEDWDSGTNQPPDGADQPGHATSVVLRRIRNSKVTQWVKDHYQDECQFCGVVLKTRSGRYSEGAHVRALGSPHNGPDQTTNVLCLCPNCHVLFDKGGLYVKDCVVYWTADHSPAHKLLTRPGHDVKPEHFAYHRQRIAGVLA